MGITGKGLRVGERGRAMVGNKEVGLQVRKKGEGFIVGNKGGNKEERLMGEEKGKG